MVDCGDTAKSSDALGASVDLRDDDTSSAAVGTVGTKAEIAFFVCRAAAGPRSVFLTAILAQVDLAASDLHRSAF